MLDWRIESQGTWVLEAHAHGMPVFADPDIGVDLRMSDKWFTRRICLRPGFALGHVHIARDQRGKETNYDFRLGESKVTARANANAITHGPKAQARSRGLTRP